MTVNLEPFLNVNDVTKLCLANNDIFHDCNQIVSEYAHALHKNGFESDLTIDEVYEHLWMILAAFLQMRAQKHGNHDIIQDWLKFFSG